MRHQPWLFELVEAVNGCSGILGGDRLLDLGETDLAVTAIRTLSARLRLRYRASNGGGHSLALGCRQRH
jgi:hypothetical protein